MNELLTLADGLAMGESPRWHDGHLWLSDWGARELLRIAPDGRPETIATVNAMPFCFDWLPDGTLLVMTGPGELLRGDALSPWADLRAISPHAWNEIAVHPAGHVFVNTIGFEFGGDPDPGAVACVDGDGHARQVAGDLAFPNGMRLTPDGSTLIVAESYAARLTAYTVAADGSLHDRRVWAQLREGAAPDGIWLDAQGAAWYGDVPNRCCVRVREGGEVLQTVSLDQGCFACALGGADGRTLHMVCADWPGVMNEPERRSGRVLTTRVEVAG